MTGREIDRRRLLRPAVCGVLGVVFILATLGWFLRPPGGEGATVDLVVRPGASLRVIGADLERAGLVRWRHTFVWSARLMGAERELRAGNYVLPRGATPWVLVGIIRQGVVERHQVTIPEGLTLWETAGLLAREARVDSTAFVSLATDSLLAAAWGVPSANLEGYLYPNTYDVPLEQSPSELIPVLVEQTLRLLEEGYRRHPETTLRPAEVVILASIVEAEARVAIERPRIAAVYLNRLRQGWRLEADPTVLYALGERRRVLYQDLEIDSPWNTYRHRGLPPTPICSPGEGAIRAAFAPDAACKDFYFVARGDGSHQFSRTLREHEQATLEIKRQRRGSR